MKSLKLVALALSGVMITNTVSVVASTDIPSQTYEEFRLAVQSNEKIIKSAEINKAQIEKLLQSGQIKNLNSMSKEEISQGIKELRQMIALMDQDLKRAEKRDDGRIAVKVSDKAMTVAGAALLVSVTGFIVASALEDGHARDTVINHTAKQNIAGIGALAWIYGGVVVGGAVISKLGSEAVLLLKPAEADSIKVKIQKLNQLLEQMQKKLNS